MQLLIQKTGTTTVFNLTSFTNYAYKHDIINNTISRRTRSGRLYTYNINSEHHKFTIPITNLSSFNASTINSWWEDDAVVSFTENSSTSGLNSAYSCKITNTAKPLNSFLDANFTTGPKVGVLILETI